MANAHLTAEQAHALLILVLQMESISDSYDLAPQPYGTGSPDVVITPLFGTDGRKQRLVDDYLRGLYDGNKFTISDAEWEAVSSPVDLTSAQVIELQEVLASIIEIVVDDEYDLGGDDDGVDEYNGLRLNIAAAEAGYHALMQAISDDKRCITCLKS